jgi:membrane protein DedA with SNARE-associated domain
MMDGDPLGAALLMAAPLGLAGVFALALAERLVPLLPSSGLFIAIGGAAAEGLWCLWVAVAASVLGSSTGAFSAYRVGTAISVVGSERAKRMLRRRDRLGRTLRQARSGAASFPFLAQLIPATRILAPLVGGAASHNHRRFIVGTIAGLALWNTMFIVLGFAVARLGGSSNATSISLIVMLAATATTLTIHLLLGRRRILHSAPSWLTQSTTIA